MQRAVTASFSSRNALMELPAPTAIAAVTRPRSRTKPAMNL
jgi:hypothetical protein